MRNTLLIPTAILSVSFATTVLAQAPIPATVAARAHSKGDAVAPPRMRAAFRSLSGQSVQPRITARADGSLRSASGFVSRFYTGEPPEIAQSFVQENPDVFGGAHGPTLRVLGHRPIARHVVVRLQQTVNDIPVIGRQVALIIGDNRVKAIQSHCSLAEERRGSWIISPDDALAAVRNYQDMQEPRTQSAEKVWVDRDGALIAAWAITLIEADFRGDWLALVDASDASILEVQDLRRGARAATGHAFLSNPVVGEIARVNLAGLTDPVWLAGANAAVYTYYPAVKGGADPNAVYGLARTDASGNYPYLPPDPRFSEVQAYFGVDQAARYFGSVGFPGLGAPLKTLVWYMDCTTSGCKPVNNAYYSSAAFGGEGGLFFGINADGTDPVYDMDIIFHEFTHAVVGAIVGPYQSSAFDALNEGFADYFSDSAMDDPNIGEYGALIWGTRLPYLRTASNRNQFPRNLQGEVHMDGNIWSGALWDIRKAVGASAADEIALLTIASLTSTSEYYDAATAAVNAAGWLYDHKVARAVESILSARGLLGQAAAMAAGAQEIAAGKLPVIDAAPGDPGGVGYFADRQFKFYIPPGAQAFTLQIMSNGSIIGLIKHRSPAVVYEDGTYNAEYFAGPGGTLTIRVTEMSDPEIQAGWHYVWVAQLGSQERVEYGLRLGIEYGGNKPTATRATLIDVNGSPASGSAPLGQYLNSREFVVQVPTNATGLGIRLDGDTDVDLFVKYNAPVRNNSQGFPDGDVARASASTSEVAILTRNTIPTLQPGGTYVVGVFNHDETSPAHFTVKAITTDAPEQPTQAVPLTAGSTGTLSFSGAYGAAVLAPEQYVLTVPANANGLRIRIDTNIDALIYIRAAKTVTLGTSVAADYGFRSMDRKTYEITTSSPMPLRAGKYYLAVASQSDKGGTVSVGYSTY